MLTEDIEFTIDCVLHGECVGYCHEAELFDEQPETFRQSWRQRMRWAKGFFQVFRKYGRRLIKGSVTFKWACFDMTMNIMPAFILSILQILSNVVLLAMHAVSKHTLSIPILKNCLWFVCFAYGILWVVGVFALITEWRKIHCPKWKAVLHLFTFPLFMMTYIPISAAALFSHVEWKPIEHKYAMAPEDVEKGEMKNNAEKENKESKS